MSPERPKLKISITEDAKKRAKLYSPLIPQGAELIGTVSRGLGDDGALIKFISTGLYAQCNAGVTRTIDQFEILYRFKLAAAGATSSEKKARASAKNARLGGRPKKKKE